MKFKLEKLYLEYIPLFTNIVNQFPNVDIAGPLLMSPNEKYNKQKIRLLVIGQETNGWGYHSREIMKGMRHYEEFNLGEKYYSSPFWNVTRKVERLLGNDDYSCAWTNISKYDVEAGRPFGNYLTEISKIDDLLIKEIEILRPDIILFFTGPSLDNRIRNIFREIEFSKVQRFSERQFALLKHPKLPTRTFRTYHPKSLRIQKLESSFLDYLKGITEHNAQLKNDRFN